jgi:outer membrane protein assembly factor BamB
LVFAIMDGLAPARTRGFRVDLRLQLAVRYVALLILVATGVALGNLVVRVAAPSATPSPSPSGVGPSTGPSAAPRRTADLRLSLTGDPGPRALELADGRVLVGTPERTIIELDAATGRELGTVDLGLEPISLTAMGENVWIGGDGDDLTVVNLVTEATDVVPGAGGPFVIPVDGALWVSRLESFVIVDPTSKRVVGTVPVPGRRSSDPAILVGGELWAGAGTSIARIDRATRSIVGTIDSHPSMLIATAVGILAIDRGQLVRIGSADGRPEDSSPLLSVVSEPYGLAADLDRLWISGSSSGEAGELLEIDLATMAIRSRTPLGGGGGVLLLAGDRVWVAVQNGALLGFAVTDQLP